MFKIKPGLSVVLLAVCMAFVDYSPAEAKRKSPAERWADRQLDGLSFRAEGFELYSNEMERDQFHQELTDSILSYLSFCKRRKDNKTVMIRSCRTARGGCEERISFIAGYIIEASEAYNINPWLLAAMAYNESRYNPFAEGPNVQSRGVLQLNPKSKRGRSSRFARNGKRAERFRKHCKNVPGNCQRDIVFFAADHMDSSVRYCGTLAGGLSMYNTGRCDIRRRYIKNTARAWKDLQMNNGERDVQWCDRLGKKKKKNDTKKARSN